MEGGEFRRQENDEKVTIMDALFARYFDGDLNEREAREFLDSVESDPAREKALREYERLLALGKSLPAAKAPAGFTKSVMSRIRSEERRATSPAWTPIVRLPLLRTRWVGMAAAAALVVLAYIGGVWTARERGAGPSERPQSQAATDRPQMSPGSTQLSAVSADGITGLRYVRLVYVPADPSVDKVSVAGSFNDWDPAATPLRLQNGVWSTVLVLRAGKYEYMFVEDGKRWVTDPLAAETRDDGFGGANAILDVGT